MTGNRDILYKPCGCADKATGRQLSGRCPRLAEPGHGSWYFAVQVSTVGGRKARYRRGGFPTRDAARAARGELLERPADLAAARAWTVARWMRHWLKLTEPNLRPATVCGYRDHINRYLIPGPGRVTLADLDSRRLQAFFDLLARQRTRNGTPLAAATTDRVRATLRSALNAAVREGLITASPLANVRLPRPVWPVDLEAPWGYASGPGCGRPRAPACRARQLQRTLLPPLRSPRTSRRSTDESAQRSG